MSDAMENLYNQRLARYTTAMRSEMPDMVPIRPFVAEFTGTYAGMTSQELAHDYNKAFEAALKCAADFDWDAVVPNMVYVWTGIAQALGLKYYDIPGIHIPPETGFQYHEPPVEDAFMRADEYDALIADPTGFLYDVWLPRASTRIVGPGQTNTRGNNFALVKGAMSMLQYFYAFGPQIGRMRSESGTCSAIAGILKAPLDIIADKMRGYLGLVDDLFTQPDKVMAACEALAPHLLHVARTTADPDCNVPVGFWMHRGCVPFVSPEIFENMYWATLKPIIQELWAAGHQTLFYAEGNWDMHLQAFAELPDRSIVYHVDQGDIFRVRKELGDKFCLSGGIRNVTLGYGTPEEVREEVKRVIEGVAGNGGYILDAGAIVQNDALVDNMKALTEAGREYGVYSRGHAEPLESGGPQPKPEDATPDAFLTPRPGFPLPGEVIPWDEERKSLEEITGDEQVCRDIWQQVDGLGDMFIWQVLLSF